MGTRGAYGFRKDGVDKVTYNHWDSYPSGLGASMAEFCASNNAQDMMRLYRQIQLVSEGGRPTAEQIGECRTDGLYDGSVSSGDPHDWYCLLRNLQGEPAKLKEFADKHGHVYMIDDSGFLTAWSCEYAYIINLDTGNLEFWRGAQTVPQPGNRYGEGRSQDGNYPCKLSLEIPLNTIKDADAAVDMMVDCDEAEQAEEEAAYDYTF